MNTQAMLTELEREAKQLAERQQQITEVIRAIKVLNGANGSALNGLGQSLPVWELATTVLRHNGNGGLTGKEIWKTLRSHFPTDPRFKSYNGIYAHLAYAERKRVVKRTDGKYQAVA